MDCVFSVSVYVLAFFYADLLSVRPWVGGSLEAGTVQAMKKAQEIRRKREL